MAVFEVLYDKYVDSFMQLRWTPSEPSADCDCTACDSLRKPDWYHQRLVWLQVFGVCWGTRLSGRPQAELGLALSMTELHEAARTNQVAQIHVLLAKGVDINARDKHSRTALHLASFSGHLEAVKALLLAKCNVAASAKDDTNALHFAALKGHTEVCRQLLHAGIVS